MTYDEMLNLSFWLDMIVRLGLLMVLASFLASLVVLLERRDGRKRPRGIIIFCVLLMLGSLYKLWGLWNYDYYRMMFQQLTEQEIFLRYCISVLLRLVGLVIAVGVLLLKNVFRKALLLLCSLTLCLLYWKHPFYVFENIAHFNGQLFFDKMIAAELSRPIYLWISLIFYYILDIVFAVSMLYYFTRQRIKELFN
jgi:hypothetical protein